MFVSGPLICYQIRSKLFYNRINCINGMSYSILFCLQMKLKKIKHKPQCKINTHLSFYIGFNDIKKRRILCA